MTNSIGSTHWYGFYIS